MKVFVFISILLNSLLNNNIIGQCSMSKYENIGYDVKAPSKSDSFVLKQHKSQIDSLLNVARCHNKTRLFTSCIPNKVLDTEYASQLITIDKGRKTVPIFKLVVWNNTDSVIVPSHEVRTINRIVNTNMRDSLLLSNNGVFPALTNLTGYTSSVDIPIRYSRYIEDTFSSIRDTMVILYSGYLQDFFATSDYPCFTALEGLTILSALDSLRNKHVFEQYVMMWINATQVKIRFHIDSHGVVTYISQENQSTNDTYSKCIQRATQIYASYIIEYYDFIPAYKNGIAVNSYVDIVFAIGGFPPDTDTQKTERKKRS